MTNYERIRQMSIDEMAEWSARCTSCDVCAFELDDEECTCYFRMGRCISGHKKWLEQEEEAE